MFLVGDIVKVVRQPHKVVSKIVGEVGYIYSISSTHAGFNGLKLDGSISGYGAFEIDCLEHETGPQWKRAKEIYDCKSERSLAKSRERKARYEVRITELAAKYGISVESVWALKSDIEDLGESS